MGVNTVNVGGAKVHKHFVSEFKEAGELEKSIRALKKEIANDPNLSTEERTALLDKLKTAHAAADRAQDLTSTNNRFGLSDDAFDKDTRVIGNNIANAELMLFEALGEYTDAKGAAKVDEPSPPGVSLSDDIDAPDASDSADKTETLPTLPTGEAFNVASNPNVSATDIAKNVNAGTLALSGEDLRALATSDPKKFQEIMSELSKLPGGEATAMRLNQSMQDSLQKMNRMFSLISNITQALHDTQKALINNIRV